MLKKIGQVIIGLFFFALILFNIQVIFDDDSFAVKFVKEVLAEGSDDSEGCLYIGGDEYKCVENELKNCFCEEIIING